MLFIRVVTTAIVMGCICVPAFAKPHHKVASHVSQATLDRNYARDYNFIGQQLKSMSPQIVDVSPYISKYKDILAETVVPSVGRTEAREAARSAYDMFVTFRKIYFPAQKARMCLAVIGDPAGNKLAECDWRGVR